MGKRCIRRVVDSEWRGESEPQIKYTSKHRRVVTWHDVQWLFLKLDCGHENRADLANKDMTMARCYTCEETPNFEVNGLAPRKENK